MCKHCDNDLLMDNLHIVDFNEEDDLLKLLVDTFTDNGKSALVIGGADLIHYLFSELVKMEFEVGMIDFENGIYDDYGLAYGIMIDDEGNIVVEKCYNDWFNSEHYGDILCNANELIYIYEEDVDDEFVKFAYNNFEYNSMTLFNFKENVEVVSEEDYFDEFKCIGCDMFEECYKKYHKYNEDNKTSISFKFSINGKEFDLSKIFDI